MLGEISFPPHPSSQEFPLQVSSTTSTLSSDTSIETILQPCALNKIICRLSDPKQWILLHVPFTINYFGHCRHFLTICPKKHSYRPYFMMVSTLKAAQGRRCSPQWNQLRLHADGISMNGKRIWGDFNFLIF